MVRGCTELHRHFRHFHFLFLLFWSSIFSCFVRYCIASQFLSWDDVICSFRRAVQKLCFFPRMKLLCRDGTQTMRNLARQEARRPCAEFWLVFSNSIERASLCTHGRMVHFRRAIKRAPLKVLGARSIHTTYLLLLILLFWLLRRDNYEGVASCLLKWPQMYPYLGHSLIYI